MRSDKPSLWLTLNDGGIGETVTTHTNGSWELHIITHLISHCNVGGVGQIDKEISTDIGSGFEDCELGYVEVEPVPVAKSKKEKRRRKQREKQDAGNVLLQCCKDMTR